MEIAVGMHQDQGKREYQQDAMSIKNFGSIGVLAILADGMGGYEGGEIASKIVSENFREFTIEGENIGVSLKKYLLKGNDAIKEYKQEHTEVKSMGTTAIAFFMTDKNCQWVSVGDSPLYVIRNRSTISRINENHSVAGLLDLQVKKGEISQEEALSSGQRHMLTSAVSGENIPQIETSVSWTTKSDDIFILASDGIETISDDRIKEIVLGHVTIATQENMQNACEALVQEVMAVGTKNQDNVTVILLAKMEDGEPKTALYRAPIMAKKNKLVQIGIAVIAFVLLAISIWYFMIADDKKTTEKSKPDTNKTELVKPAQSTEKSNTDKDTLVSDKPKVNKKEDNNSSVKKVEKKDIKKENLKAIEKNTSNVTKEMQELPDEIKKNLKSQSNDTDKKNVIQAQVSSKEKISQQKTVENNNEIEERNKELEESGGV